MKKLLIITFLFLLQTNYSKSQDACQVLKKEISKSYEGSCKKGLAHGKGKAGGKDLYVGHFRKGLPDGYGVYVWSDGSSYKGYWSKGVKDGEGEYKSNNDSVTVGVWEDDEYKGPIPVNPKVIDKTGVTRHSIRKVREGNQVIIELYSSGVKNTNIDDLTLQNSSGTRVVSNDLISFENIEFPFTCKVRYSSWNKLRTNQFEVVFHFTIHEEGYWKVDIHN